MVVFAHDRLVDLDFFLVFDQSYHDLVMQHRRPSLMASALMAAYLRVAVVMLYNIVIYLRMVNKFFFFFFYTLRSLVQTDH